MSGKPKPNIVILLEALSTGQPVSVLGHTIVQKNDIVGIVANDTFVKAHIDLDDFISTANSMPDHEVRALYEAIRKNTTRGSF